jgi:hypothetical protein
MQICITTSLDYPELCGGLAIPRVFRPGMVPQTTRATPDFRHADEQACYDLVSAYLTVRPAVKRDFPIASYPNRAWKYRAIGQTEDACSANSISWEKKANREKSGSLRV